MINASDKTEPAGPSPPRLPSPLPISRPLFPRLLFSLKFGHAVPPKSPALVNLCHSPLRRDSPRCVSPNDTSFLERYRYRKENPLFSRTVQFLLTYETHAHVETSMSKAAMLPRDRRVSRIHLVRRLNSRIDESDEMGESVINHAAGARVPRVAAATSPVRLYRSKA